MSDIAQSLEYQEETAGSIIFNFGDIGDKFYLVVSGVASVWFPIVQKQMIDPLKKFHEHLIGDEKHGGV